MPEFYKITEKLNLLLMTIDQEQGGHTQEESVNGFKV
jgi:hypothetical protein